MALKYTSCDLVRFSVPSDSSNAKGHGFYRLTMSADRAPKERVVSQGVLTACFSKKQAIESSIASIQGV